MSVFRRGRAAKSDASISTPADDVDNRVRLARRRDLYEMRYLADEQLQAAVSDSLQASETLHQAQKDNVPGRIAAAHARFAAATRLTQARTDNRDQINAVIDADFGDGSAAFSASRSSAWLARVRQLIAALRPRSGPPRPTSTTGTARPLSAFGPSVAGVGPTPGAGRSWC